jgi:hypothetical protein
MASYLDQYRNGSIVVATSSGVVTGSYFGLLILVDGTVIDTHILGLKVTGVLTGASYPAGLYIPVHVSSISVSAGRILIGKLA